MSNLNTNDYLYQNFLPYRQIFLASLHPFPTPPPPLTPTSTNSASSTSSTSSTSYSFKNLL